MPHVSHKPPSLASIPTPATDWRDSPDRYGRISRWLHWGMALLFAWQFAGMLAKVTLGKDASLTSMLSGAHSHVGLLLLVLLLVRGVWGLLHFRQRPSHATGWLGALAWLGHMGMYALMLIVPFLAMLRMLGNTRAFNWFGWIPLNNGMGEKVEWMVAPASAVHGLLGWALLALIAGHIVMVMVHRWVWKDDVAQRMLGRL